MKAFYCVAALVLVLAMPSGAASAQDRTAADHPIRLAQAADQTSTTPSVTPVTPNSSSATCQSACSTQLLSCQNSCNATAAGTTIVPSMSVVGVTTNPNTCSTNCNTQQTLCQRSCNLQQ